MDSIANLISNIKNAKQVSKPFLDVLPSKLLQNIAKILADSGYITKYEVGVFKEGAKPKLRLTLKYDGNVCAITNIVQISKQGLRIYKNCDELPHVLNNLGIAIISTNKGIITDKQARKEHVGGEVIAHVW